MCGRYKFTVEQEDEAMDIQEKLNARLHNKEVRTGDIRPTDSAPILISLEQEILPAEGVWGFPKFDGKGVIINARVETAFEKKIFRESLVNRRCIIPSTGFYEWDHEKRQLLFRMEGTGMLYMAGIYNFYQEEMRYVILTTQANESVREVHDRMPLVIPRQEIAAWLMDQQATGEFLKRTPPQLVKVNLKERSYGYQYRMDL